MKIKGMILKNFRQYPYAFITFPDEGFIGIVGENGQGKSTILNAIGFVFYNKIKKVLKEDIKYLNAGSREDCFVLIVFEHLGKDYVIKRHLTKTDECFIKEVNGPPLVNKGSKNLTTYITETFFKMDYESFCSCYYAQQEDFDALSKLTPSSRRETLTRLLRINSIDKASDLIKDEIKEDKEAFEKLQEKASLESKHLETIQVNAASIEVNKVLIQQANETIETLNNEYKNLLVKRAEGEQDYQTFLQLRSDYKGKLQDYKMLDGRIIKSDSERLSSLLQAEVRFNEIKSSIDEYNQLLEEKEELAQQRIQYEAKTSLTAQIKNISTEVNAFKEEYAALENQVADEASLRAELEKATADKTNMFEEVQTKNTAVQEMNFTIRSLKEELTRLKETKEKYEKLGKDSPCPTCDRPLGEHFDDTMNHIKDEQTPLIEKGKEVQIKRDALQKEIETMKTTYDQLVLSESTLSSSLQSIEKKKDRMSFIQQQVNGLNQKYNELMPRYEEVKSVHFDNNAYQQLLSMIQKSKTLHDEANRIQNTLHEIPVLTEKINTSKAELHALKRDMDEIEAKVKELGFDEESYKKLTSLIETSQNQIHEQKENVTRYSFEIKACEQHIETAKEQLKEIGTVRKKMSVLESELEGNLFLVEAYKAYKRDIISTLVPDLSNIMSDDIERVTKGYYTRVELDRDFNIFLYRFDEKKPLSFYSGGEQKLAALLQLLGVSHLLTAQTGQAAFDMVAMDEVLGTFDNKRAINTVEQLKNLKEIFPQVLMVTHQDEVKELFDYSLVVSTNEKRESQVSWSKEWDDSEIRELMEEYIA